MIFTETNPLVGTDGRLLPAGVELLKLHMRIHGVDSTYENHTEAVAGYVKLNCCISFPLYTLSSEGNLTTYVRKGIEHGLEPSMKESGDTFIGGILPTGDQSCSILSPPMQKDPPRWFLSSILMHTRPSSIQQGVMNDDNQIAAKAASTWSGKQISVGYFQMLKFSMDNGGHLQLDSEMSVKLL